jgi:ribose/xylose/arabinose/galactoside ABC-type transport system permease subunit
VCKQYEWSNKVTKSSANIGKIIKMLGPLFGIFLVYIIFLSTAPDAFHSIYNSKTILTQTVIIAVGAMGMTLVIISGGIDLSVGSLIALGTVVTALVLKKYGGGDPGVFLPIVAGFAAVVVCAFCGLLSGSIVSWFRIVPFIVTLGVMQIARGVAKGIADQKTVLPPKSWLDDVMVVEPQVGVWHSIAPGVWVALVTLAVVFVLLKYTVFGRHIYAIGSNEDAARLCGINVNQKRIAIYSLCGGLTGMASVLQFSNLTLGDPTAAVGMELDIIAAVVIGGGSLNGGEGSVTGSVAGALIMAILRNGCVMIGIPNYVQNVVIGSIIILAVGLDGFRHRRVA